MNPVHEHCSSQNFSKKKNFKNEIFVDEKCFKGIIDCLALLVNARIMCIH